MAQQHPDEITGFSGKYFSATEILLIIAVSCMIATSLLALFARRNADRRPAVQLPLQCLFRQN